MADSASLRSLGRVESFILYASLFLCWPAALRYFAELVYGVDQELMKPCLGFAELIGRGRNLILKRSGVGTHVAVTVRKGSAWDPRLSVFRNITGRR